MQNLAFIEGDEHSALKSFRHIQDPTDVSELFFSELNVNALHEAVRYLVYKFSECKHVIQRQSDDELQIIMRGIYLEHGKNAPFKVVEQVRDLNALVLDFAVPRILNEISAWETYQSQALRNPIPQLDRPASVSVSGPKSTTLMQSI